MGPLGRCWLADSILIAKQADLGERLIAVYGVYPPNRDKVFGCLIFGNYGDTLPIALNPDGLSRLHDQSANPPKSRLRLDDGEPKSSNPIRPHLN